MGLRRFNKIHGSDINTNISVPVPPSLLAKLGVSSDVAVSDAKAQEVSRRLPSAKARHHRARADRTAKVETALLASSNYGKLRSGAARRVVGDVLKAYSVEGTATRVLKEADQSNPYATGKLTSAENEGCVIS